MDTHTTTESAGICGQSSDSADNLRTCKSCSNDLVCHDLGECKQPTPDYGEPWQVISPTRTVRDRHDKIVSSDEAHSRMLQCVNACAGMTDPAAEIQAMRDAIKEAHEALLRVSECKIFYAESMDIDNHTTDDCASTLAKLKLFTTP